ncbi:MAG TPA: hypothetical protein VNR64_13500 [Vicinamibacterales bacterium]|nr:hypothetical protein [Vicinamibacterales bacterium]
MLPDDISIPEPLIAYISGDTPPDFEVVAAFGFTIVCLDTAAPWYSDRMVSEAKAHGLMAIAFRMGHLA